MGTPDLLNYDYLITGRHSSPIPHYPSLRMLKVLDGVTVPHVIFSVREEHEMDPLHGELPINEFTKEVLHLQFSDVEEDGEYHNFFTEEPNKIYLKTISEKDADRIVEFYAKHRGTFVLAHCMAGISRSAAILYGLSTVFQFPLRPDFFSKHAPNIRVVQEIIAAGTRYHSVKK